MVFTRKKFFIIQILFLISSTIFLSGCTAQYQSPVSGPTANVDFITHPGVEKYTVYILEKTSNRKTECYQQRRAANILPINYKDHLKFKIPAGKKFVTKIITEQNQAGITYQCNMVFSFVPKPKTEYQAEIYMDKNKTDCNLVVSETTKDGQQLVTVKGEKLSQSWDRKLMGDPTFCSIK